MIETFYHGTNKDRASSIVQDGVDLEHPRKSDPGDFGLGFYVTKSLASAKSYGECILLVEVDLSRFAYVPNPYDPKPSMTKPIICDAARLFYQMAFVSNGEDEQMLTVGHVHEACRWAICKTIREEFMRQGFDGIRTDHDGHETVIFDLKSIKDIRISREVIDTP